MTKGKASTPVGRPTVQIDPRLPDDPTIVHALAAAAERVPERAALICGERSITYAEYFRAVTGLAHGLREREVAGGRVALVMMNSIEAAVGAVAAMAAGAQAVPLNFNYPPKALAPLVRDAAPAVVLCDRAFEDTARGAAGEAGVPHVAVLGEGGTAIDDWIGDASLALPEPLPEPGDLSVLFYTGGTTGLPKGANHTHGTLMAFCRAANTMWAIERDAERLLNVAPIFHIWGFCHIVFTPIFMGATVDVVAEFKPEAILRDFEKHRITVFAGGPPALYIGLRAHENFAGTDFSHLKYCLSGGAPCPGELLRGWEAATGCALLEGLGMSEGAPISMNPVKGRRKLGSTGIPAPLTEIDIVDLETGAKVLPPGERGEIRVRGPQFTPGYRNRPEDNKEAIRDGWLYTGDIGRFDEDGYLFVVDRKKELILVGGYNVYPREVDEVLHQHPAVLEAATVGVPDDFRGEAVTAFVALKPGAELSEDELLDHCRAHLVKYKVPTRLAFLDALPKTGPGKINKLALKGPASGRAI